LTTFNGSNGNDIYTGGADADQISGNGGSDTLSGGGGNDTIAGGGGADNLSGGDGDDQLFSHAIYTTSGYPYANGISYDVYTDVDTLIGGAGDDYIFAGYGDNVDGGTQGSFGNRLFISFQGASSGVDADFRPLQAGHSVTIGGGTITNIQNVGYLEGSNYDDTLAAIDTYYPSGAKVYGRGGNDYMVADYYAGWGDSGLWGGDGNDTIDATGAQYGPKVHGDAGDDLIRMRSGLGDIAYGDDGNDTIYAGGEAHGGAGNDLIVMQDTYYSGRVYGDGGNDVINAVVDGGYYSVGNTIAGGSGADTLNGGAAADRLASGDFAADYGTTLADDLGRDHDVLNGGGGDDTLAAGYGDDVDGGTGTDTLSLSLGGALSGVTIDLSGITGPGIFTGAGGAVQNVETLDHLTGSAYADTITVGTQASLLTIDAGGGDDKAIASGSSVEFHGESGNDTFVSGIAGDRFDGGDGFDTADYSQFGRGINVTLGAADGAEGTGPGGDALTRVEQILGTAFADTMTGSNQGDALVGNDGNDSLASNGGSDTLNGGSGNDTLDGGAGGDTMDGGSGDDRYYVDNSADRVIEAAGGGNDQVVTNAEWVLGTGQEIELVTIGGSGWWHLTGNELANTLVGNAGSNMLWGMDGNDTISGGDGNDIIDGGAGSDQMIGGAGDDFFYVNDAGDGVAEDANGGNDKVASTIDYTLGQNVENLALQGSDDLIGTGNALSNGIWGNDGNNNLRGGDGNDTIEGGGGNDRMEGDAGNDSYVVQNSGDQVIEAASGGNDSVPADVSWTLGAGQEVELLTAGLPGAYELTGNELANGIVGNDTANILHGMAGDDTLTGNGDDDVLDGGDGSDHLNGGIGHDVLSGGEGADVLIGGDGNDHVYGQSVTGGADGADSMSGGDGSDYLQGNAGNDTIDGGAGSDRINGGADNDLITGGIGRDIANGNRGDDTIDGGAGNDSLRGGQDNDRINGGDGGDTLSGDLGNDRLSGDNGDDLLDGGRGADTLTGGTGADTFNFDRFAGTSDSGTGGLIDELTDFAHAVDHIHLEFVPSAILTGSAASAAAAITAAEGLMGAHAGFQEVALMQVGGDTYLVSSGTGASDVAELAIKLDGVTAGTLTTADFV
jgi:Ca2+-binding RTX toxin-like protein